MSFQWIQRDFHRTTLFFVSIYFQWTQSITKIQKTVTCLNRFGNKPTDQDKQTILPAGGKNRKCSPPGTVVQHPVRINEHTSLRNGGYQ